MNFGPNQIAVLRILAANPGMSQTQINKRYAELLKVESVRFAIRTLVKNGYVKKGAPFKPVAWSAITQIPLFITAEGRQALLEYCRIILNIELVLPE